MVKSTICVRLPEAVPAGFSGEKPHGLPGGVENAVRAAQRPTA